MKFSSTLAASVVALSISVVGSAHAASIVTDGDFSNPPGGSTFSTYTAGTTSNSFGPWTVTSGSIDLIGNYWQNPSAGGGSVDLDGNNPGGISQTLNNLNPGNYVLTFSLSGNPEGSLLGGPCGCFFPQSNLRIDGTWACASCRNRCDRCGRK